MNCKVIGGLILQVYHVFKLDRGQDIAAVALNKDNTNLLVSTADRQLIVFTDPAVCSIFIFKYVVLYHYG